MRPLVAAISAPRLRRARGALGRGCALLLAMALLPAAGGLTLAWLLCGLSWWSGALSLGLALLCFGLLSSARRSRVAKSFSIAGLIFILGPWLWRAVFARG